MAVAAAALVLAATPVPATTDASSSDAPGPTVDVPLPRAGATAVYDIEAGGHRSTWTLAVRGMEDAPFVDGDEAPTVRVDLRVEAPDGDAFEPTLRFHPQHRTIATVDGFWSSWRSVLSVLEYRTEARGTGLNPWLHPLLLSHVPGRSLAEDDTFAVEVPEMFRNGTAVRSTFDYEVEAISDDPATAAVHLDLTTSLINAMSPGPAPVEAVMTFEDGVAFPTSVAIVLDDGDTSVATTLASWSPGASDLDWDAQASSDRAFDLAPVAEPLVDGIPPDGGADLAYPLADAVEAVRTDPTLLTFRAWRDQHPEHMLRTAFLHPHEEAGLEGFRWFLLFQEGSDTFLVESTRFAVPGPAGPIVHNEVSDEDGSFVPRSPEDRTRWADARFVPLTDAVARARSILDAEGPLDYAVWDVVATRGGTRTPCWTLGIGTFTEGHRAAWERVVGVGAETGAAVVMADLDTDDAPPMPVRVFDQWVRTSACEGLHSTGDLTIN